MTVEEKGQKVNLNKPLLDLDGSPVIKKIEGKPDKVILLKDLISESLLSTSKEQGTLDGDTKVEMFALALKVFNSNGKLVLTSGEGTMILNHIALVGSPLVVGRVYEVIK